MDDVKSRIFDTIIKIKRGHLADSLRSGGRPPGLPKLFEDARCKLTGPKGHQYPPYSKILKISPEEFDTIGAYTPETHMIHMKAARAHFDELDQLCTKLTNKRKANPSHGLFNIPEVKDLIMLAFRGRHSKCFPHLLTLGDKTASRKLYNILRKLSRYWKCTEDLVECAQSESLTGLFKNVEFCAIPRTPAKSYTSPSSNQNQLLKFLTSLGYHEAEVLKRCGSRYSKLNAKFGKLQEKDLYVHAEIGLIYYYATHPELQPAREIGCSKHACFLCDLFIKHHPNFRVRATHKKVYVGWGLPDLKGVGINDAFSSETLQNAITKTMQDIEDAVKTEFDSPRDKQPDLPPDSSSGVSETEAVDSGTVSGSPVVKPVRETVDSVGPLNLYHDRIKNERGFPTMAKTRTGLDSPLERLQISNDASSPPGRLSQHRYTGGYLNFNLTKLSQRARQPESASAAKHIQAIDVVIVKNLFVLGIVPLIEPAP